MFINTNIINKNNRCLLSQLLMFCLLLLRNNTCLFIIKITCNNTCLFIIKITFNNKQTCIVMY